MEIEVDKHIEMETGLAGKMEFSVKGKNLQCLVRGTLPVGLSPILHYPKRFRATHSTGGKSRRPGFRVQGSGF